MRVLRESMIIIAIYFLGELLSKTIITFIPGNILGMIILLVMICTKVIKLEAIENVSKFFLDNLAFLFVPAGVGLLTAVELLKGNSIKLISICIISTFIVMGITSLTVDGLIKRKKEEN
ncbi:CidA/LrgA family protein [Clostridium gasigenes]|uniref:CidA/LrgA family protein n=1 Tax=Clostridium gasigenes TaxID=94869 RepID=UPI0016286EE8|nr:CidA/LrgA family protein [Clostridium gasigenes]MBB6625299.1 CidA/LrgA family protein [Clostridium gasigenes]